MHLLILTGKKTRRKKTKKKKVFLKAKLNLFTSVREEDLVLTLKMTPRDIHRICGKLKEDRLIKM